jgi:energy-coupling factor transporter ATP-binding protein EcfA2
MKITKLELEKFCAFKKATFEFSPGINVFIGSNATGKSHLLKLLYSILKANEKAEKASPNSPNSLDILLRQKLINVFRPDAAQPKGVRDEGSEGLGRLVYRMQGKRSGRVNFEMLSGTLSFQLSGSGKFRNFKDSLPNTKGALFVPSREAFAMFEGFAAAYENRELSFDETYYDLCNALSANPTRGPWPKEFSGLQAEIEKALGGRVHLIGGRFYVYNQEGVIEAHMLAEGMRKLGSLFRLLQNQSLTKNGYLFWDEPEANLNPKLVALIARILRRLAAVGVQVFVTTHDYLLSTKLSLAVEYPDKQPSDLKCDMKFFCLSRDGKNEVNTESAPALPFLDQNPILQEFAAHYDEESTLFSQA